MPSTNHAEQIPLETPSNEQSADKSASDASEQTIEVSTADVVDYLRLTGEFEPLLDQVIQRKLTVAAAKRMGLVVDDLALQQGADAYRVALGLHKAKDFLELLDARGLTAETFQQYIEENLLIDALKSHLATSVDPREFLSRPTILDHVTELAYRDWLEELVAEE